MSGRTVTVQMAVKPPSTVVTVMVAAPGATAVTTPFWSTVATLGSLLAHVTLWLAALSGCTAARSQALPPAVRDRLDLFSVTPATL